MPTLPSGLTLALTRTALFDPGRNWFECPFGHFWYWTPDAAPPWEANPVILQSAKHAPVPTNREEVKEFIHVEQIADDNELIWNGEWLATFPRFIHLDRADIAAWKAWLEREETYRFLDETIAACQRLAENSQGAQGFAVLHSRPK